MSPMPTAISPAEPMSLADFRRLYRDRWWHREIATSATPSMSDLHRYHLGLTFTRYPSLDLILGQVRYEIQQRSEGASLGVISRFSGFPTNGKSRAALLCALDLFDEFCSSGDEFYTTTEGVAHDIIPSVYVKAAVSEKRDLMTRCLRAIGAIVPRTGTATEMLASFARACERHGTVLVVIDDIHKLNGGSKMADLLKDMIDSVPAHFLFTEVPDRTNYLMTDDQLRARSASGTGEPVMIGIENPKRATPRDAALLQEAVYAHAGQLRLPAQDAAELAEPKVIEWLFNKNSGSLGRCLDLINRAARQAVQEQRPQLKLADLARARG